MKNKFLNYINPYFYAMSLRNYLYDTQIVKSFKSSVPIISVGNLSLGGSGKTTLVRYLCENLSSKFNIAVISRGYKRKSKGTIIVMENGKSKVDWEIAGDEPYLLSKIFEKKRINANIIVDEDKKRGVKIAIKKFKPDLIILDDGFQYRKLKKDIELVLLKKKDLNDILFPFGRLRETLKNLKRADAIVLTYQDCEPFEFFYLNKPVFKLYRENWKILNYKFEEIKNINQELIAFCGLGNNEQFLQTLSKLKIKIKKFIPLPDHYHYKDFQLKKEEIYIATLKDIVKLNFPKNVFFIDFSVRVDGLIEFILNYYKKLRGSKNENQKNFVFNNIFNNSPFFPTLL